MNRRMIAVTVGRILLAEAALMVPSVLVGLIYREPDVWVFLPTIGMLLVVGGASCFLKPKSTMIFARDGYFIVAAAWLLLSVFGAMPFWFTKKFASYWEIGNTSELQSR